ncbi:MAG: hypothetical protein P1U87_04915 [Verrucomicrobiales bacterium]|nr:hypothetical protein [Verrucomicrobiales bacterium]
MNRSLNEVRRFGAVYGKLFLELFRFSPKWAIAIVLCQVFGPILQPLIIAVLSKGVRLIQGESVPQESVLFPLLSDMEPTVVLAILSVAVVILGLAGALLGWLGASGARKLGRLYRLNLTEKILDRIANSPVGSIRLPADLAGEDSLQKVTVSFGLKLNLAVICLFTAIRHGISALILAACLVYINAGLSLVFFVLVILILPFYILLNRKTHTAAKSWHVDGGARSSAIALMELGKSANTLPAEGEREEDLDWSKEIYENSLILENLETMEFGRLAGAKSQLYSQLFRAVFLGGALFLFGLVAMNPDSLTWDALIVFLIAASMLQLSISGLSNSLSMLAWHSPPVTIIERYSEALFRDPPGKTWSPDGKSEVELKNPSQNALVVSSLPLSRTSFHFLLSRLFKQGIISRPFEGMEYRALSLRGVPKRDWESVARSFADDESLKFLELGSQQKASKLEVIRSCEISNAVLLVDSWDEPIEAFDMILKVSEDGREESGPPAHWEGRDDLKTAPNRSDGTDFDFDEMM